MFCRLCNLLPFSSSCFCLLFFVLCVVFTRSGVSAKGPIFPSDSARNERGQGQSRGAEDTGRKGLNMDRSLPFAVFVVSKASYATVIKPGTAVGMQWSLNISAVIILMVSCALHV